MIVQAVIFSSDLFTNAKAKNWLVSHRYVPIKGVDKTANYLRYRIRDPSQFSGFVIKEISPGIKIVFGKNTLK